MVRCLSKLVSLKGFYGGDAPIKDKEKGTQRQKKFLYTKMGQISIYSNGRIYEKQLPLLK